jgi:NADH-quinone oxidoreductase subunit L
MAALGVLSLIGGVVQIPGVTDVLDKFLSGSFEDSRFQDVVPSAAAAWLGLAVGAATALAGISLAYYMYVVGPGTTARLQERFRALHAFLARKWYFDELYDAVVYRPLLAVGAFANAVFERFVVQGIVAGTVEVVRGVGVVVRGAQSGFLRSYALLLVGGFAGLGLYFLITSS